MEDRDRILLWQAISGIGEARDRLDVLLDRGVLPSTWREIESVLAMIQAELCDVESRISAQAQTWPAGGA